MQIRCLEILVLACVAVAMNPLCIPPTLASEQLPFNAYPVSPEELRLAFEKERPKVERSVRVTGVGSPHHLLAADMIARAILATQGNSYERIIILSPDHFFKSTRPAAITTRNFDTIVGPVKTDVSASAQLLRDDTLFADSDLFAGEHGVLGLLPFIRTVQPDTPVVAVALSIRSRRTDWDRVVEALKPIVTPRTLIVQSTDYSHYLRPAVARMRDQETLNVFATNDASGLVNLIQPDHLDSLAAAYVQMRLQSEIFGASPVVIGNRTAFDYMPYDQPTTSYVVTAYGPDSAALSRLRYSDQAIYFFGGDVFIGRNFAPLAADKNVRDRLMAAVQSVTDGAPLIVNLEGAMIDEMPLGTPPARHVMLTSLTVPILKALNTVAASQANNHSHDLGFSGVRETSRLLREIGVAPLRHLEPVDLGALRVVAVNYIGVGDYKGYPAAGPPEPKRPSDIEGLCRSPAKPPLLAFLHWGEEYVDRAGEREKEIARDLRRCGVVGIIGAHSHRASLHGIVTAAGEQATVYSVGNLMFDQFSTTASSTLVEARIFAHGTVALRVVPLPNLYELGLSLQRAPANDQR
jgi:AmmeMemoRadiSam system protein B